MALTSKELMQTGGNLKIVNQGQTQSQPRETPEKKKQPGLFQSIVQGVAKPFLKTGLSGARGVKGTVGLLTGNKEMTKDIGAEMDFGYFGKVRPVGINKQGKAKDFGGLAKDVLGTGVEVGSTFVGGGGGVKAGGQILKGALGQAVKTGAKAGAIGGSMAGAGLALQDDKSVGGVLMDTAVGGVAGGAIGGTLGTAGGLLKSVATPIKTITQTIAPALKKTATKIEATVVKPLSRELEKGFKTENIFKYKVGGTLQDTFDKTTKLLSDFREQARGLRDGKEKIIDVKNIMQETVDELEKGKIKTFGVGGRINNVVENFVKEFEMIAPDGRLTVPQAQELKEAIGTLGSWFYGQRDLDANAQEKVANILYTKIKEAIEKNSRPGLAEVNRAMSELIPIKNAVVRRIPVAERSNILSLTDVLSTGFALQNPKSWGLFILNKLSKSGRFAEKLYNIGDELAGIKIPDELNLYRNQGGFIKLGKDKAKMIDDQYGDTIKRLIQKAKNTEDKGAKKRLEGVIGQLEEERVILRQKSKK